MKWVDLIEFDAVTRTGSLVARAVLEDGVVRIEGEPMLTAQLKKSGVFSASEKRIVRPDDGEAFLKALGEEYRNAYFFATELRVGEPETYEPPMMRWL